MREEGHLIQTQQKRKRIQESTSPWRRQREEAKAQLGGGNSLLARLSLSVGKNTSRDGSDEPTPRDTRLREFSSSAGDSGLARARRDRNSKLCSDARPTPTAW